MLTKCDWLNVDGTHAYSLNSVQAPLNDFDVTVAQRTVTDREKMEKHGTWPTLSSRGGMELHCEGNLFADTAANYVTERRNLVTALFGLPTDAADMTNRKLGTLTLGFEGQTEDWKCDCTILAFSAPVRGLYPALTEYLVTFYSFVPYFIGASTSTKYYWS